MIVISQEEALEKFHEFEENLLKNYGGRVFLSPEYVAERFVKEMERKIGNKLRRNVEGDVYVETYKENEVGEKERDFKRLWLFIVEVCNQDAQRLERYRQAMEKHITEERALEAIRKFIKEHPLDEELYSSGTILSILEENYNLKKMERYKGYYKLVLTHGEWWDKLYEEKKHLEKEGYELSNYDEENIYYIFLEDVTLLLQDNLRRYLREKGLEPEGQIFFDHPNFYVYLSEKDLLADYKVNEEYVAKEILKHMKNKKELSWTLDLETYFDNNVEIFDDICRRAIYSRFLQEIDNWINRESTKKVLDLIDAKKTAEWLAEHLDLTKKTKTEEWENTMGPGL